MTTRQTVAQKLLSLLQNTFKDQFRTYRVGDPILPGQEDLPAIFVTETQLKVKQGATGMDELEHSLEIQIVFNKKDELGNPDNGNTLDTKIDTCIFGIDEETGEYLDASILGLIRKNLTLDGLSFDTQVEVRKGIVPRPQDMLTAEGQVDVTISEFQVVNNRT